MERTSDDILCIFKYADENNLRNHLPVFCAATLARVPDVPDEMSHLTSVRNNVNTILNQLHSLTECMSSIKPVISEINEVSIQTFNLLHIPPAALAVIQPPSAYDNNATHDTHTHEDLPPDLNCASDAHSQSSSAKLMKKPTLGPSLSRNQLRVCKKIYLTVMRVFRQ